jgi:ribosomal protein S18 acetylase RimI-like enzyme
MMRMVIGCGFITPDGYITYICVNPEWRNHKIAKLILYQLIQVGLFEFSFII